MKQPGRCEGFTLTNKDMTSEHGPMLENLTDQEATALCAQLREELVQDVSRTGGHLASNLGAVELTVAIHRVFDTGRDRLVFDVGHQCYLHKMLTGRREQMATLRQYGGIAGFPKPNESVHDALIAGHASNSVAVAREGPGPAPLWGRTTRYWPSSATVPSPAGWPTRDCPMRDSVVSSCW